MEKNKEFTKIEQQATQQVRKYKKVLKEIKNLISQDFGIVFDIDKNQLFFINNNNAAKKLFELQKKFNQLLKDAKL